MSRLVDGQVAGRQGRYVGEAERPVRSARRTTDEALRRPPGGARRTVRRPRVAPVACVVARPRPRWGAIAFVAVGACAVVFGFGAAVGGLAEGMGSQVPERTAVVAVAPGQTLWDVASEYAPDSDPRAVVRRIEELNGVTADGVSAGSALTVPVQAHDARARAGR